MLREALIDETFFKLCLFALVLLIAGLGAQTNRDVEAADPPVVVAVIGDFGSGSRQQRRVADLIDSWDVDFIATVGDNVYSSDSADPWRALENKVGKFYHEYLYPYKGSHGEGSPTGQNRFFPALGNHDWGDPGAALLTCDGGHCSGAWTNYFNLPGNERYYDVRQGALHLFVIDDYYLDPSGNTAGSVQGQWLKNSLAASDAQWKIVVNHFPPYSSGGGEATRMRWPFEEWGADAVISGHRHVYERLEIGQTLYFVNGLGGAGKGSVAGKSRSGSKVRYAADNGAMRISATADELQISFFDTRNQLIDSVTRTTADTPAPSPNLSPDPSPVAAEVFDATNVVGNPPYDVADPTTTIKQPTNGSLVGGAITLSGTAYHGKGVRQIEIVVRNSDNQKYWNPVLDRWQKQFIRFGVYASPRGWRNVTWQYTIPASRIGAGNYTVRAWARSWTGSGDSDGSARVAFRSID